MHPAVAEFVAANRTDRPGDVWEVGSRNINGTVRHLFGDADSWTGVDLIDGPDVDIVGDICDLGVEEVADLVVCLEVLEHAPRWGDVVAACAAALRPGGTLLITAAAPTRTPHSGYDGGVVRPDEHYANIDLDELAEVLGEYLDVVSCQVKGDDVQAVAVRV